ncbi:MAG: CRISPR-associated endonuclease Cas2 [Rickettsiales bacterium]|jgi:CRISPR-associated protein Cas2|nr:CRISPR-associated endonuclease Cas2 [Rickettsiales bacterium]
MRFLICYDVADDSLRNKIVKILESYGERVQYSVFEFNLNPARVKEMKYKLIKRKLLDRKKMSFSIYSICENCYKKVERYGENKILNEKNIVF